MKGVIAMKLRFLASQFNNWVEKWGKLGKANGVKKYRCVKDKKAIKCYPLVRSSLALDKEFRGSLAYFH
jgi:hypothetical protein